ncbi:uncharacterized protein LOC132266066 isoform X2 [Phlebotomus argentipes]|uniref:uncharacterized protein LOC132266066 isoform X2 n=1 Tax=Phlebotomus argentipes TaxID=94469 RepID=UPI002893458F|nr:uncharacterized protein LOC132266066 isoform X2 [Phlebotomus argentipes]
MHHFAIQFDKGVSRKEKDFYRSKYPQVDKVMDNRIHCTSCDTHLGTAPMDEVTIREHPVLKVTQCSKCYAFYTSGEFDKGEDGSELYCRWCGQGGEVFCCAKCPFVFCKKCIVRNLSKNTIRDIVKNENWMCFSCEPEITWPLRAKHWALKHFMEKQRKVILAKYQSDADVNFLLSRDLTTCCQKEVPLTREARKSSGALGKSSPATTSKTTVLKASQVVPPQPQRGTVKTRKRAETPEQPKDPPAKRPRMSMRGEVKPDKRDNEVVCTPDILSMFEGGQAEANPPPLTQIRQYGAAANGTCPPTANKTAAAAQKKTQTITIANQSPATPIYHTINGYRIDLNSAARQETIRLPNGKLIQVKKQSTPQMQQFQPMAPTAAPAMRGLRPQAPGRNNLTSRLPTRAPNRKQPATLRPQSSAAPPTAANQVRPLVLNGMMQPQCNVPPLIISQQVANSPYGKAKMELDSRIRNGQEICMHIIGKMNTLVASNAYKSMKSIKDVKEIHIHLSYLLTYAINRFKTLQEKSMENMKTLGFGGDVASIMSGKITASTPEEGDDNDDDIEIVEPQTTLIDLASDEEDTTTQDAETPKVKESQMFLDKLKMQPKILLKKLPGSTITESVRDKEGEEIVTDILKGILEEVLDIVAPRDVAKSEEKPTEGMEVDAADSIALDDDDSGDVEIVDKVQSEEKEKTQEDEEEEEVAKEEQEEIVKEDKEEPPKEDEDVEMQSKECDETSVEEKNQTVEAPDAEMSDVKDDSKHEDAVESDYKTDEAEDNEAESDDKEMKDVEEERKDSNKDEKPAADDQCEEAIEPRNGDVKSPEASVQEDSETVEESKSAQESPASPDAATPTAEELKKGESEFRAFEDIDSPDEFDDALDTPADEDDLLDDLVKPNDVPFSDDLDSLGKFLENQG